MRGRNYFEIRRRLKEKCGTLIFHDGQHGTAVITLSGLTDALAGLISKKALNADYVIPAAFDPRVDPAVARAVAEAARKSGVARI